MNIDTTYFVQSLLLGGKNPDSCHRAGKIIQNWSAWVWVQTGKYPCNGSTAAEWLNHLRATGSAPATIRAYYYALKSYLLWKKDNLGALASYRLPSLPTPVPHPLPGGMIDLRTMLDEAQGSLRIMIALQGLAGLRVHEARLFGTEMVDTARRELIITGKGGKHRRIPISAELWKILDIVNVVPGTRMVGFSDRGARLGVTRVAERCGVTGENGDKVSSHDLRATFATACYEKTGDILLVSRLLGHASVTTTQVYLGLDNDKKRNAVEL